ncbi:hypothetical protein ASF91_19295 [Rhizobium sp. Leaf155]|nr:hypothetical protein ASF91_19295 [Rhizobium sp. Leaf155]
MLNWLSSVSLWLIVGRFCAYTIQAALAGVAQPLIHGTRLIASHSISGVLDGLEIISRSLPFR